MNPFALNVFVSARFETVAAILASVGFAFHSSTASVHHVGTNANIQSLVSTQFHTMYNILINVRTC